PDVEGHYREQGAYEKGHPPSPVVQLGIAEHPLLENQLHTKGQDLSADQGHILEARIKTTSLWGGHLSQVSGRSAIFSPYTQSLDDPCQEEQGGSEQSDLRVAGRQCNHQRTQGHQKDGDRHGLFPSQTVRHTAKEPAADRAHEKTHGEDACRIEQLGGLIAAGKKYRREIDGKGGIGV